MLIVSFAGSGDVYDKVLKELQEPEDLPESSLMRQQLRYTRFEPI